jgi:hypothetical protein
VVEVKGADLELPVVLELPLELAPNAVLALDVRPASGEASLVRDERMALWNQNMGEKTR